MIFYSKLDYFANFSQSVQLYEYFEYSTWKMSPSPIQTNHHVAILFHVLGIYYILNFCVMGFESFHMVNFNHYFESCIT
jgi:hypothetical protein